jgi:tRNA (Thr-GGU) A37 N-methylase
MVFWWADGFDQLDYCANPERLRMEPPYARGRVTAVFDNRAPYWPNPIAMATCAITVSGRSWQRFLRRERGSDGVF